MIFTLQTPFSEYVLAVKAKNACKEAVDWCEKVSSENKDLTINGALDLYINDTSLGDGWAYWNLTSFESEFDINIKKMFLSKVKEPMIAFQLFKVLKETTKSEETILRNKFRGKLPTAEKELRDGILIREKDRNANN